MVVVERLACPGVGTARWAPRPRPSCVRILVVYDDLDGPTKGNEPYSIDDRGGSVAIRDLHSRRSISAQRKDTQLIPLPAVYLLVDFYRRRSTIVENIESHSIGITL